MSLIDRLVYSLYQAAEQRLRKWARPESYGPALNAAWDLIRCKSELVLENALLLQRLIVLERHI